MVDNIIEKQSMDVQEHEKEVHEEKKMDLQGDNGNTDKKSIKISKKTIIIIAIVIVVAVLIYFGRSLIVAATVNGSPISRWSVIEKLEKTTGKSLLDSMITEKLIQDEAKAKKIVVTEDEINAEIKKIEDQIKTQGITLDSALSEQGMTRDDLKKQILLQKEVEKLVADKISVTEQEISKYIADNKVSVTKGEEGTVNEQVKSELINQKLNTEAQVLINELKSKAKIKYFASYK